VPIDSQDFLKRKVVLPVPEIESRFLGFTAHSLVQYGQRFFFFSFSFDTTDVTLRDLNEQYRGENFTEFGSEI
jgi:hypothetical protein